MPRKGQTMLYRQVPRDFPEVFVRIGWGGIEKHYHAHAKTIKRWLLICGYAGLKARRAEYVNKQRNMRRERAEQGEQAWHSKAA